MNTQLNPNAHNGQPDRPALLDEATIRTRRQCSKPGCECQRDGGRVHCPAHDDEKPALSIDERNGKTLFHCHAGCSQEAVLAALLGEVAPTRAQAPEPRQIATNRAKTNGTPKPDKGQPVETAAYTYTDEAGEVLFRVQRKKFADGSKDFPTSRPDGRGGWVYSLGDTRRVLYRLEEVLAARFVIVCEGEKAGDEVRERLEQRGLLGQFAATTNPHGAGKWRPEYSPAFEGKIAYITPDNDDKGRDHAQAVALGIEAHAEQVSVFELPGLPDKGDAVDFFASGGTVQQLLRFAETAPTWTASATDTAPLEGETASDETEQPATKRPRFVFVGAQQVKAQKPPRALIEGVLFENTGAELCGGQATLKSFVALSIAEAIASGADWHGRATRKTPACYITGEGSAAIGKRIRALEIQTGRSCEVQFLLEAVQLHQPEEVEALLLAIAQLPEKPGLIVVDTLARCFVGGEENSARDAGLFVAGVDRIRAATGATVLILHHINKSGDTRGSTAFAGAFDTMIEAKRENTIVSLRCLKQKDAPDFEAITLARRVVELDIDGEDGQPLTSLVFETTDAPEPIETPSKGEATRARVLELARELFASMPEGIPANRFKIEAEGRGLKWATFQRHRDALRGAGEITFDGSPYHVKKEEIG